MKRFTLFFPLAILTLGLFTSSCKKKCVMEPNNLDKGWIEENVIFYPKIGYLTSKMDGNYVVTANSQFANQFEVSIDGGAKEPVDYNNYTILCYPILSKCNAQFVRDVSFNSVNQTVEYEIEVTQCSRCEEERITENYVLVPKFPSNYQVTYDISYVNIE
jgi:hypothetical protein